jgi:hypothetical protein
MAQRRPKVYDSEWAAEVRETGEALGSKADRLR